MYFHLLLSFCTALNLHPIHVSVSEVELLPDRIVWTMMIYKDDLFLGLYGKSQNKQASGELDEIKVDIAAYLDKHISISFGDQLVKWQQFEVHADPEAIWITLTSEMMKNMFKSFTIRNNVLQEHYSDQKNIIHMTSGTKKKDILFERNDKPKLVTF